MDIAFHYPPELMSLLIDTIPLLCRSKKDTLLFLQGSGFSGSLLSDLRMRLNADEETLGKHEIVRAVLTRLNEHGEATLRERREVLKRVIEFEHFSACWPNDQLKAQGLVTQIQKLVNVKDSFTRMKEERERERQENIAKREAEILSTQQKNQTIQRLKDEFFALFAETNPHKRGKQLESVLNRLFKAYEISIREDFTISGESGEGIIEQIDGVVEFDGHLYFVEMKWWKQSVGVPEISQHMMRVFLRAEARAIIISASDFSDAAVIACKEALSHKVVTLCTLQELVMLLENQGDLREFLRSKVRTTILDKNPFPHVAM